MTLRPGQRRCSSRSSAMPSISAMRRSVMTRSGRKRAMTASALAAFSAGSTSYFCERNRIVSRRSSPGSSSTTRIFGVRLLVRDMAKVRCSLAFRCEGTLHFRDGLELALGFCQRFLQALRLGIQRAVAAVVVRARSTSAGAPIPRAVAPGRHTAQPARRIRAGKRWRARPPAASGRARPRAVR